MRIFTIAIVALLAGCTQQSSETSDSDYTFGAQPAGSTIHPAEATGYMDTVDPESYPPSPSVRHGAVVDPSQ